MKKILFFFALLTVLPSVSAQAGTLKEGAVICISQKYLEKYEVYAKHENASYLDRLLDRAQCVVKGDEESALLLSEVGDFLRLETEDGFKVWVNRDSFSE